jgi:hypothetical protein
VCLKIKNNDDHHIRRSARRAAHCSGDRESKAGMMHSMEQLNRLAEVFTDQASCKFQAAAVPLQQ